MHLIIGKKIVELKIIFIKISFRKGGIKFLFDGNEEHQQRKQ